MATCPRPPAPRRAGGGAGVVEGEACALACAAVCGAWGRAVRVRPRALAPIYDCAPLPSIKCTYIYNLKGLISHQPWCAAGPRGTAVSVYL